MAATGTGIGATATMVAAARAVASSSGLISDPFAEPLVRAAGVNVADLGDDARFARMADLFAVRTRFFDDFFADAGKAGIRQAVILASGLDARPYRLWWPAGTTVYEIDQPHVIDFKTQVLRELGATPTANRRAVGVDLRQDWPAALRRAGFDAAQPSAWIAEGLLIGLLPPDAQDRLLDDVTALSAAGSRFAADHMPVESQSQQRQERGEHNDFAEYLAAHGWETVGTTIADLFAVPVSPWYVTATRS